MKEKNYVAKWPGIEIHGKGEAFHEGIKTLVEDMKGHEHWFRCKKCGQEWQDDTHCSSNRACPKCGNPIGKTMGCFSEFGVNKKTGESTMCPLIHGLWEGAEGICKCQL